MRRMNVTLAALVIAASALACGASTGGSNPQATAEALSQQLNATGTAEAQSAAEAEEQAAGEAAANATATAESIAAAEAASNATAEAEIAATQQALAPVREALPTYGVDPATQGEPGWVHPPITVEVSGPGQQDYVNFFLGTVASDFVISAEITMTTDTGLAGCGFVIRSDGDEEAPNQYVTLITRGGGGSIAFLRQVAGNPEETQVPFAQAVDPTQGGTNRLTIKAVGDTVTFYANGTEVDSFAATEFDRGLMAMVAVSESGTTTCEFNNAWMWLLEG